jgi:hypothetical protein
MTDILIPGKAYLITGQASSWQGPLARSLAFDHVERGYVVIELIDRAADVQGAEQAFTQWCKARKLKAAPNSFHVIAGPFSDVDEIIRLCMTRAKGRNAIIFRDLSTRTLPTMPGASWLGQAEMLAHGLGFAVVTAAWDHSHSAMRPQPSDYKSQNVYYVTATERDTLSPTPPGIFVSLTKIAPTQDQAMKFCGQPHPTIVVFDDLQQVTP